MIPREIRKALERNLPSYALDYLTEKFNELEKYCQEAKLLSQENMMLREHNMMLQSMFSVQGQQNFPQQMGYQQEQPFGQGNQPSMHHLPWEYPIYPIYPQWEEYPEFRRGRDKRGSFEMRRGVPGTGRRTRSENFYAAQSQGQGGGQGGSSGGNQGGDGSSGGSQGGSTAVFSMIPAIEKIRKINYPPSAPDQDYDENYEITEE